ncbi:MAG: response regulator transcription factor [Bacteroidetes bacterium]|nr:response regulator transcription factor [Bacteroidota bacterium]
MKIVIIEDEAMNVEDLGQTLMEISFPVEIVAVLSSVKEAIVYFEKTDSYDLIFSDIHLGDGLSFDIFKEANIKKPVIFCTAYDKYALEAFNNNGIAYVLKPYNRTAIQKAVLKYLNLTKENSYNKLLEGLSVVADKLINKEKQVLVHHKDKIVPISIDSIAVFYIENDVTKICCFNQSVYVLSSNLDEIENEHPSKFYRANRQYLINKKAIKEVSKFFARKLLVHLTINFQHEIIVSKTKSSQFLTWLGN